MDTKDLRESAMHLGAYGTLDSDRCNQAADLIDQLRADLAEATERVTFWMDAHAKDCAELQDIRNHLSLTLAQRNEELLQAKAEATRYREALGNAITFLKTSDTNQRVIQAFEKTLKGGD